MKNTFLFLWFLIFFGCSGFEPIFSTKDLRFYIGDIENVDNKKNTKKIIRNIRSYKLDDNDNKKEYILKINSKTNNLVTSRDSKGNPLTYSVSIDVEIKVFKESSNLILKTIFIKKDFIYNYQTNQFALGQYKKDIIKNLVDKISEEIIVELQLI